MITHAEDAFERCPDCGCRMAPARVDPPTPNYSGHDPERPPKRPSFAPDCCPTCGSEPAERSEPGEQE